MDPAITSDQDHGASVSLDEIRSTLSPTRRLRLSLDVLSGDLPTDMETDAIRDALWNVHERLSEAEATALRMFGLTQDYIIVRPINPINPPDPGAMHEITSALKTLACHGLLITA